MRRRIQAVAEVRSGYQFRSRIEHDPAGSCAVIQIRDIDQAVQLNTSSLGRVSLDRSPEPYLVQQGDVLFLSRGHHPYAVVVEQQLENTIATGYFYVLRPRQDAVRSAYVAWYLNQEPMQARLKGIARGSHMPFVPKADFEKLTLPVPSLTLQDRIVGLAELLDREQRLLTEIAETRAQLVQALCLGAAENHK